MLSEDQYLDRTPDLVAKVRKMREAAEKEMNRFTRAADYDVRRVVGRKPKETPQLATQAVLTKTKDTAGAASDSDGAGQAVAEVPSVAVVHIHDAESV